MGTHGVDPRSGFTTPNILEAETNRALIQAGRRLIVLADHTKWGIIGISSVARLEEADTMITDGGLDTTAREQLAAAVRRLILVDVATGERRTIVGGVDETLTPTTPRPGRRLEPEPIRCRGATPLARGRRLTRLSPIEIGRAVLRGRPEAACASRAGAGTCHTWPCAGALGSQ